MAPLKLMSVFLTLLSTHGVVSQNCQVENIPVQADFDFSQMMGKWYVISWFADDVTQNSPRLTDYIQNIAQTADNEATIYAQGRSSPDAAQCESTVSFISNPDESAKLLWTSHGVASPYWVVDTDYSDYAFVYGCYNVSTSGFCSGARAWTWSRSQSLSQSALGRTAPFYQNTCLQEAAFETISFDKDCDVKTHIALTSDQDCTLNNVLSVQENFDLTKYMGTWYEIKWLALKFFPASWLFQDYQHRYVTLENGHTFAYIYGRSPDDMKQCFYNTLDMRNTTTPGKFYFAGDGIDYPYWVLKTDYTQYAVAYGCYNESSDGSCYEARSWVWSRTPTLPDQLKYQVNSFLQTICVNPTAYLQTEQNNICPLKSIWPMKDQNCNVSQFPVQSDFDVNKFTRVWYETHWLPEKYLTPSESVTDKQVEVFATSQRGMTIFSKQRSSKGCEHGQLEQTPTDEPGKFVSARESRPLWVAGTDYSSYAVLYTCERVGSDGGCESARGSVWSRSPTLSLQHQYTVNSLLQDLCLNPSALSIVTHSNACLPERKNDCEAPTGSSRSISSNIACFFITFIVVFINNFIFRY